MSWLKRILMAAVCAVLLAACENRGTGETVGTLGGAAAGGLLGSQIGSGSTGTIAAIGGALLGGWLGNTFGRQWDDKEAQKAIAAEEQAVSQNRRITWTEPETGARGVVTPERTYAGPQGRECREYTHTVYDKGGNPQQATGSACKQDDGSWRLVG